MTKILIDEAVVRQALAALELVTWTNNPPVNKAIIALRQALEQPAPAQPDDIEDVLAMVTPLECKTEAEKTAYAFGWFKALESVREQPAPEPDPDELTIAYMSGLHEGKKRKPWVNLTVDELIDLEHKHRKHEDLVRAIEAKLKEKNTKGGAA